MNFLCFRFTFEFVWYIIPNSFWFFELVALATEMALTCEFVCKFAFVIIWSVCNVGLEWWNEVLLVIQVNSRYRELLKVFSSWAPYVECEQKKRRHRLNQNDWTAKRPAPAKSLQHEPLTLGAKRKRNEKSEKFLQSESCIVVVWWQNKSEDIGWVSADRDTKATLMLTTPSLVFKSYTKDLSLPIFVLVIQHHLHRVWSRYSAVTILWSWTNPKTGLFLLM